MAVDTHRGKPPVRAIVLVSNLIVLLSVCLGVVEGVVALKECEVDVVVMAGGEEYNFTGNNSKPEFTQMALYGKVKDDFEGFSVNVEGTGGIVYSAWFPADHECFPDRDTWYQILTFTEIKKNNDTTIMLGFETRYCRKECKRDTAPKSLQQQSVVVYGASHWSEDFPQGDNCNVRRPKAIRFPGEQPACSKRPTSMSTMNIIVIVIVVLVVIAFVILLSLYIVKFIKKRAAPYDPANTTESG